MKVDRARLLALIDSSTGLHPYNQAVRAELERGWSAPRVARDARSNHVRGMVAEAWDAVLRKRPGLNPREGNTIIRNQVRSDPEYGYRAGPSVRVIREERAKAIERFNETTLSDQHKVKKATSNSKYESSSPTT